MKALFLILSLFFFLALNCSDRQEKGVSLEEKLFSNSLTLCRIMFSFINERKFEYFYAMLPLHHSAIDQSVFDAMNFRSELEIRYGKPVSRHIYDSRQKYASSSSVPYLSNVEFYIFTKTEKLYYFEKVEIECKTLKKCSVKDYSVSDPTSLTGYQTKVEDIELNLGEVKRKKELESELEKLLSSYDSSGNLIEDWIWIKKISFLKDSSFRKKAEKVLGTFKDTGAFRNLKVETIFSKDGLAFFQKYIFKEGKLEEFEYFGEVQFKTETGTTRTCVLFNIIMTVESKQYHHSFQVEFLNEHIESGFWYYFPLDSQYQRYYAHSEYFLEKTGFLRK